MATRDDVLSSFGIDEDEHGTVDITDANGTLRTAPFDGLKGQTGEIVVKATINGSESLLTIPVRYR